jgi:hypothetical protein
MTFRKSILMGIGVSVTLLGGLSVSTTASADVGVYFHIAPPAPRHEIVPAPRHGYVWAPGYWDVRGHHHAWTRGHWERERRGYHYSTPAWTQRDDRWELQRGHWNKGDRDGDGVPNSVDRSPNDPHRS